MLGGTATRLARPRVLAAATLRGLADLTLGAALPPLCPSCRAPLADARGLCAACWSKLTFITRPYCERLGIPFAYDAGPGLLSLEAIADPPAYGRARAVAAYDDIAAKLVHALKYGDRLDLAPTLGRWMATAGADVLNDADALVPVPLHWRRLWARRFNQSAALAHAIGKARDVPVVRDALRRVKATPQQVGLSRNERALNMQGAFRAPERGKAAVVDRRLLLVDDVLTSGATVEACARALLRAGAANVDVLVFARVVGPARPPI
jgi:ComF family protein